MRKKCFHPLCNISSYLFLPDSIVFNPIHFNGDRVTDSTCYSYSGISSSINTFPFSLLVNDPYHHENIFFILFPIKMVSILRFLYSPFFHLSILLIQRKFLSQSFLLKGNFSIFQTMVLSRIIRIDCHHQIVIFKLAHVVKNWKRDFFRRKKCRCFCGGNKNVSFQRSFLNCLSIPVITANLSSYLSSQLTCLLNLHFFLPFFLIDFKIRVNGCCSERSTK